MHWHVEMQLKREGAAVGVEGDYSNNAAWRDVKKKFVLGAL